MATIMSDVISWSNDNLMNTNWNKTKEMLITTTKDLLCDVLSNNNSLVERVYPSSSLVITVDDNLKWGLRVNSICAKASK